MKKVMLTLSVLLLLLLATVAAVPANATAEAMVAGPVTEEVQAGEPEALFCKVEDADGNEVSCWFCNCRELAEEVLN